MSATAYPLMKSCCNIQLWSQRKDVARGHRTCCLLLNEELICCSCSGSADAGTQLSSSFRKSVLGLSQLLSPPLQTVMPEAKFIVPVPDWEDDNYWCTSCLYGTRRNDFDAGKSISRAIGRGGHWKSRLFWDLKWQRAKWVPFGPKKVKKWPGKRICPHQNH